MMRRVTGIGGIFFKAEDPKKLKEWYAKHLEVGEMVKWMNTNDAEQKEEPYTVWSPFKTDTTYFSPSEKPFMVNFRVENLVELLKILKEEGIEQVKEMETHSYGKFAWIMDPEGNKIELWEPAGE